MFSELIRFNKEHPANALLGKFFTKGLKLTVSRLQHPSNAESLIYLTFLGICTNLIFLLSLNAPLSIVLTKYGIIT